MGCDLHIEPFTPRARAAGLFLSYAPRTGDEEGWILTTWFCALPGAFHCEYKTQEHIHRDVADSRLLAIPTS